jgi:PfaB family protein
VIRGIGLASDGRGETLTSPNPKGQLAACRRAYGESGIDPATIDFIECHATGTPIGDRAELALIRDVFAPAPPPLGAVKGQIGHVMTASGGAGLVKLLLAMEHGEIPPTPGIRAPIAQDVRIPDALSPWPKRGAVRRAALNSFGFGGTNGHLIVEEAGAPLPDAAMPPVVGELAITGMALRIGPWADLDSFAASAYQSKPGFGPLPAGRWRGLEADTALLRRLGFGDGPPEGAYLDTVAVDPLRLRIPPKDLDTLNPQQWLMLQVADAALKDAGLAPGGCIAVVVAMAMEHATGRIDSRIGIADWLDGPPQFAAAARDAVQDPPTASDRLGCIGNVMAGRIAALWDFSGPAFTLSAGQGGVAHALAVARLLLDSGEADAVLVGAVDLAGGIENLAVRLLGAPAPEAWKPGEGAAAIVLRRAPADAPSYATIRGLSLLRDGDAEHGAAAALAEAGITPDAVGYLEAADPEALALVYGAAGPTGAAAGTAAFIAGDCGVAGGLLGIIHAALAVANRFLPAGRDPVPAFQISGERRPWLAPVGACFAAVHLPDPGGAAGHVILAAPTPQSIRTCRRLIEVALVVPVPGADGADIAAQLGRIIGALRAGRPAEDIEREAVARHAASPHLPYAACLVAQDAAMLEAEAVRMADRVAAAIQQRRSWRTPAGSFVTGTPIGPAGKTAFVYSGVDSAYPGQCRDVLPLVPGLAQDFLQRFDNPRAGLDETYLFPMSQPGQETGIEEAAEAQLAANPTMQVVIGVTASFFYTRLATARLGVQPDMALGYSLGEVSMLFASDTWRFDQSCLTQLHDYNEPMLRLCAPGALAPGVADPPVWGQYAVAAPSDTVGAAVAGVTGVYLTLINSPVESTLIGESVVCERVLAEIDADWIPLAGRVAMHCPASMGEYDAFVAAGKVPLGARPPHALMFGAGSAEMAWTPEAVASRVALGLVQPVDFRRQIEDAWNDGARLFVEVKPGSACTRWIDATLADKPHIAVPMARRGTPEPVSVAQFLAVLVGHRRAIDLAAALDRPQPMAEPAHVRRISPGGEAIADRFARLARALPPEPTPTRIPHTKQPDTASMTAAPTQLLARPPAIDSVPALQSMEAAPSAMSLAAMVAASQSSGHLAYLRQRTALAQALGGASFEGAPLGPVFVPDAPAAAPPARLLPATPKPAALFTEADFVEMSDGRLSNVFGPDYAPIDALPLRVRMASQPFTQITRVTEMSGTRGVFDSGHIVTEYDVPPGHFFQVGDSLASQIPLDGQGVLFLLSYLGIDFESQGRRRFRWLDAHFVNTGDMPRVGETLRYDITLRGSFSDGQTRILTFDVLGTASGRPVIHNTGIKVGFFSDAELASGSGLGIGQFPTGAPPETPFIPLLTPPPALEGAGIRAMSDGDFSVLSPRHVTGGNPALRLPKPSLLMIDRITAISATGGVHGRGYVIAERLADPEHWPTKTHFRDDEVVPGPCLMDGVLQLLRTTAVAFGMHVGRSGCRFESLLNRPAVILFRKQMLPHGQMLTIRADIVEIGMTPEPFIAADVAIMDNGLLCGTVKGIGIRIAGPREA